MINPVFNLPKLTIVGGDEEPLRFRLLDKTGDPFDATDCDISFAVVGYANDDGEPLFTKTTARGGGVEIEEGLEGLNNVVVVSLDSADTALMQGRYIYQLSIVDTFGQAETPGQGTLDIVRNINPAFVIR